MNNTFWINLYLGLKKEILEYNIDNIKQYFKS